MDVVFVKIVFFVKFMKEIRIKNYTYFYGYFQFFLLQCRFQAKHNCMMFHYYHYHCLILNDLSVNLELLTENWCSQGTDIEMTLETKPGLLTYLIQDLCLWVWSRLGKGHRKILLVCVMTKIRNTIPLETYTGLQYLGPIYWTPRKPNVEI